VRQELRAGVAARHRKGLLAALSGLPVALPSEDTWRTVERWTDQAAASGERFGVADLLIGALASELGALVWSYDGDFARMAHLKLVQLYG
jgi:predicted nucleic acid-binding protein